MCLPTVKAFWFSTPRFPAVLSIVFPCALNTHPITPACTHMLSIAYIVTSILNLWVVVFLLYTPKFKKPHTFSHLMFSSALNVNMNISRGFFVFHFSSIVASNILCYLIFSSRTMLSILKEWCSLSDMIPIGLISLFSYECHNMSSLN